MQITDEMKRDWEHRVPDLSGKYTHWWLTGDGGDIIVTSNLKELIDSVAKDYGKSLKIRVNRAYLDGEGNCIMDTKSDFVICNYVNDAIRNDNN